MMLPVAIMALAMFISYQRAKAESLGFDAKGGIMERAERIIVLALALLFAELLIPILWVMLVLTAVTAVQRFVKVWRQASQDRPLPARRQRRQPRRTRRSAESVWRQRMRTPGVARRLRRGLGLRLPGGVVAGSSTSRPDRGRRGQATRISGRVLA
ncbi:MAG: hypothetical protein R2695_09180 [Acidimicrobiales bacterium]